MEKRLKKQRKKLIFRIATILLAVWFVVSTAYSFVRLNSEKINIQNRETKYMLYAQQQLYTSSETGMSPYRLDSILVGSTNLLFDENGEFTRDRKSQIIVTDSQTGKKIADTVGKLDVVFGISTGAESSSTEYGFLEHNRFISSISEEQFQKISEWLNTKRDDEKYYQLICTEFYIKSINGEIIPTEVQIVLTDNSHTWYVEDEPIETFELNPDMSFKSYNSLSYDINDELYQCNKMNRNVIPNDFVLNSTDDEDIIGSLSKEQLQQSPSMIRVGLFDYIFYSINGFNYTVYSFNEEAALDPNATVYVSTYAPYLFEYAKRVNIFDNCKSDLIFGVSILFLFFLIIAIILCVMMWHIIKNQILQEQKRVDITNALAHDIKTPLFVISGFTHNLKENLNTEKREYYADKILQQTDSVNELVHKMIDLSKLDSVELKLNATDFNLLDLVEEVLINYMVLPDKKSINLTHKGDNIINADRELIKSAIENLIDNAVKYSTPNSKIEVEVSDKIFCISNECNNLTKSDLKQIWQPYVRKDKSRNQVGNGLGLSIVKSILDLHRVDYNEKLKSDRLSISIIFGNKKRY